ncbi:hypothetical protein FHS23_000547 [Prauserella isguenensis]|uniref:Flagellar basal body-associated protein FliL n=1 Tax=Prauserella isguenensis TaxID=1470180 RepID=A0A839RWQ0_9PSEU|nr:SHOCT domain-containing protein [Prauserella isguenensis]MBB3049552.1 hypothetical protein [Prauserella isguenensis]
MSWQEELRRLDAQLTAGALTEAEHRRKRDEILAEASSDGDGGGNGGGHGDGGGTSNTGDGDPSPQQGATGRSTTAPAAGSGEQTSDGPTWAAANPAAAAQLSASRDSSDVRPDANRPSSSQNRSSLNPSSQPPSTARRAPAPLFVPHTPANGSTRPAEQGQFGAGLPPVDIDETSQASDYPDFSAPAKKRRGTWIVVPLVILLVLGGVIGGAWWLGTSGDGATSSAPASDTLADPDGDDEGGGEGSGDEASLSDRLPELPGEPSPDNSTMSVDRALDLGFITDVDAESMRKFGVADLVYRASAEGRQGYSLLVARSPSEQKAVGLQRAMNTTLVKEGFSNGRLHDDPRFISFTGEQADGRVSIVWYASGNKAVGIGVSQPTGGDERKLIGRLEETLTSLQDALPASS